MFFAAKQISAKQSYSLKTILILLAQKALLTD